MNNPDNIVCPDARTLASFAKYAKDHQATLISRSVRQVLSCFDDLDVNQFETHTDFLVNYISIGTNKDPTYIQRPKSIIWPEKYHSMCDHLAYLDSHLWRTGYRDRPVDWMLQSGLTSVPECRQCKAKMDLKYENRTVRWQCFRTPACRLYFMPIQRPSFFRDFEKISLQKLLFSIYYWSTCTPGYFVHKILNLDIKLLDGLWMRMQNVCRTALEKAYPRHRLTNITDPQNPEDLPRPIDLVSIKFNDLYIVCAKHPCSNHVRLGLWIPKVSQYSFAHLTESWFAHGSRIRTAEPKFMSLSKHRTDLNVELVPRLYMINKDGKFDRDGAFGYLICQLTNVCKDLVSSAVKKNRLKLILAEMEWRELYGTTPYDAFTNIINHMVKYNVTADHYSEPSTPTHYEEFHENPYMRPNETDFTWTEKYFYATIDPIDADGKVIARFLEPTPQDRVPLPEARFTCHICREVHESFKFSMHLITHVEKSRRELERIENLRKKIIECKHCFKIFKRDVLAVHTALLRSDLQLIQYGCRICCIKFDDRPTFLQHMRQTHYQHEAPYRCPKCLFASSFQRDVFIHFDEEHRHSLAAMCPLCLRSFTVLNPEKMNENKMAQLSKMIYNHLMEHYAKSKCYSCENCCLNFLDDEALRKHVRLHHNPMEIHDTSKVTIQPFIVTEEERMFCVKAIPIELFIPNKRPNYFPTMEQQTVPTVAIPAADSNTADIAKSREDSGNGSSDADPSSSSSYSPPSSPLPFSQSPSSASTSSSDDEDDKLSSNSGSYITACDTGAIYVRGLNPEAEKLLEVSFHVSSSRSNARDKEDELTSEMLIEYMSKLKRADGIIPNQSVILMPTGKPATCCECMNYITIDHYVAEIKCPRRKCRYLTHCHRAALMHVENHKRTDEGTKQPTPVELIDTAEDVIENEIASKETVESTGPTSTAIEPTTPATESVTSQPKTLPSQNT